MREPRHRSTLLAGLALVMMGACTLGTGEAPAPGTTRPPSDGAVSSPPATATTMTTVVPATAAPATIPLATTVPALMSRLGASTDELAAQLVEVERTIRRPDAAAQAIRDAGELQQLVYRRLGRDAAGWEAIKATLPPDVLIPATTNVEAATALGAKAASTTAPPTTTLPAWTIADPLPAATLIAWYREAEAATGVPWSLLAAINLAETRMGRIVGVSSAGAVGPMQFLPTTWDVCCVGDPTDTHDAILGAATYLAANGAPDDLARAVRQYNPNDAYVTSVLDYATNMAADERAYLGYYAWQVFVGSSAGSLRLPIGYSATERIDAAAYLAAHPEDRVG